MFGYFKYFIQRQIRGFDDRELWSLDTTLAKWLYPRFKALREIQQERFEESGEFKKAAGDIEYFLHQLGRGEDGYGMKFVDKEVDPIYGQLYGVVSQKDVRFHSGRRSLYKYLHKMWW